MKSMKGIFRNDVVDHSVSCAVCMFVAKGRRSLIGSASVKFFMDMCITLAPPSFYH